MSIRALLKQYHAIEIELLLAHVLKKPKEFLFLNPNYSLSENQRTKLSACIKRRLKGEPIAYLLGFKDFYGLRFLVNKQVLIPRPETESLVSKVLQVSKVKKSGKPLKILDLGTGSGCIAVTLAKKLPKAYITASDISKTALQIAKQNAKLHKAKVRFVHSNLFTKVKGRFDIVVANLPYVPKTVYRARIKDLRYEPRLALVDPKKDFEIYERFFKQAAGRLTPKASIFLEIDPKAKTPIAKWVKKYLPGYSVTFFKDFNGLWRYAEIKNRA